MGVWGKIKLLFSVVWEESGASRWIAAAIAAAPSFKSIATLMLGQQAVADYIGLIAQIPWWTSLVLVAIWVILALATRIFKYETLSVRLYAETALDEGAECWFIKVKNLRKKEVRCVLNLEEFRDSTGQNLLAGSFGLQRKENPTGARGGPFPIWAEQAKTGKFAQLINNEIRLFLVTPERWDIRSFPIGTYTARFAVFFAEGTATQQSFVLAEENGRLSVREFGNLL